MTTKLERRHKEAIRRAYESAKTNGGDLQARYLREAMHILGITTPAKKTVKPKPVKLENNVFLREMQPSPELAAVVGSQKLNRSDVVSKLWSYIQRNKLQDPTNKRTVKCDETLTAIFARTEVSMFEIASILSKHLS